MRAIWVLERNVESTSIGNKVRNGVDWNFTWLWPVAPRESNFELRRANRILLKASSRYGWHCAQTPPVHVVFRGSMGLQMRVLPGGDQHAVGDRDIGKGFVVSLFELRDGLAIIVLDGIPDSGSGMPIERGERNREWFRPGWREGDRLGPPQRFFPAGATG